MANPVIPLLANKPHSGSKAQARPPAGASRGLIPEASTVAGWRRSGVGSLVCLTVLLLASSALGSGAALAQDLPADRATASHPYAAHVTEASQRFGIPEAWIWAVMRVESNGDGRAISTAGAMGLMQIMPATWAGTRARYGLGSDPYDVRDNIMAGAAYLRAMFDRYGNATAMLGAYNAGPGRYDEYLSRGRPLPAETRAYLAKLASITGGADDTQLAAAPPSDPFAWRRAALFAVRPDALSPAQPPAARTLSDIQAEQQADGRAELAMAAASPPSNGLFVPLSGRRPQ